MKKIKLLIFSLSLLFFLSACSINFTGSEKKEVNTDFGGIFKSADKGDTWKQKVLISGVSQTRGSLGATSVNNFKFDPSDNKALYYASVSNGLAYTYDGADSWQLAKGLGPVPILDVAVDSNSKCRVYASTGNKIFRTEDCSRNWVQVYFDNEARIKVNSIAIDHFDSSKVYAGLSRGDLLKSSDYGKSWQTIHRFKVNISGILIDPKDSRKMFVITPNNGLYRSVDGGENWESLKKILTDTKVGNNIRDMVILNTEPTMIYLASAKGMVKSLDNGSTWEKIELITPDAKSQINAIAVNESDVNEIYYVTNTTFFKSSDGGVNWTPQKLPTSRAGWKLLVDPEDPKVLYLGIKALTK
ncbi:hypothetical protein C0584_03870 [Candidatus Parcubacteria bacterium]|nr:MAG: hypothetical protein C0584_03870 [Candidatus Parcubacteria bacterium]